MLKTTHFHSGNNSNLDNHFKESIPGFSVHKRLETIKFLLDMEDVITSSEK